MKVRFIINPKAGTSGKLKALPGLIREILGAEQGIFEVKATTGPGSAATLSREAAQKGYEFVFACGGDGTVNEVASSLVGTDTALGIIPTGSGNALARTLGIPDSPEAAVRLLKTGQVRPIDVGKVGGGRYFFTTAGFAFEGRLSRRYDKGALASRIRGIAPYYVLSLMEFFRFRPEKISLTVDGYEICARPLLLTAANTGQWGADAFISPSARVDDGILDFCVVPKSGLMRTIELGRRVLKGTVEEYDGFQRVRGKEALIKGRRAAWAHVDGEPFEIGGEVSINVLPGALRVLMPAR